MALLPALAMEIAIPVCAVIGIAFSLVLWYCRSWISDNRYGQEVQNIRTMYVEITGRVSEGVNSILFTEFLSVGVFVAAFAILIFLLLGSVESFSTQSRPCKFGHINTCKPALATAGFSTVSFLLGAFTSALSGFLGTKIAFHANDWTALENNNFKGRTSIAAFRSGAAMGFLVAAIGLLVLYLAIILFKLYYGNDWVGLFEAITGYGLGGSSMALFGGASGGIYARAADVRDHLVQEIKLDIRKEYRNPTVITNYVGDITGDIAGMGPDLFGSYASSSCAALVVASSSSFGIEHNFTAMCYPLLISSMGILVCLITTLVWEFKPAWKKHQLIISTILMTVGIGIVSWIALPSSFTIYNIRSKKDVKWWQLFLCVGVGLGAGLIIGFVNKIHTNDRISFLENVADPARNFSGALGSVSIPFFAAASIFVSFHFAATYGMAVAALGMLGPIATRLAIDADGPISHNAGVIAQMAGINDGTERNGAPNADAAGNTAAIGKGFAIESAATVSIALFGAFVSHPEMSSDDLPTLKVIIGLIMGAWLPYWFSAMTMKSVGRAGLMMAQEVCRQAEIHGPRYFEDYKESDYTKWINFSIDACFRGMILPGAIVMLTPLIVGTIFGVDTLSGLLAGSLSSVVQIAILASNTGGAWNKEEKHIRAGALEYAKTLKHEDPVSYNEVKKRNIIGDKRKDFSGPLLKILVQLMAVESLVFAPFFARHGGQLSKFL